MPPTIIGLLGFHLFHLIHFDALGGSDAGEADGALLALAVAEVGLHEDPDEDGESGAADDAADRGPDEAGARKGVEVRGLPGDGGGAGTQRAGHDVGVFGHGAGEVEGGWVGVVVDDKVDVLQESGAKGEGVGGAGGGDGSGAGDVGDPVVGKGDLEAVGKGDGHVAGERAGEAEGVVGVVGGCGVEGGGEGFGDGLREGEGVLGGRDVGVEAGVVDEIEAATAEVGEVERDLAYVDLEGRLGGAVDGGGEGEVVHGVGEAAGVVATVGDGAVDDAAGAVVAGAEVEAEAARGGGVARGELLEVGAQLAQADEAGGAEEGWIWRGGVGEEGGREVVAGGCCGRVGFEVVGIEVHGVFAMFDGHGGVVIGIGGLILRKCFPPRDGLLELGPLPKMRFDLRGRQFGLEHAVGVVLAIRGRAVGAEVDRCK